MLYYYLSCARAPPPPPVPPPEKKGPRGILLDTLCMCRGGGGGGILNLDNSVMWHVNFDHPNLAQVSPSPWRWMTGRYWAARRAACRDRFRGSVKRSRHTWSGSRMNGSALIWEADKTPPVIPTPFEGPREPLARVCAGRKPLTRRAASAEWWPAYKSCTQQRAVCGL